MRAKRWDEKGRYVVGFQAVPATWQVTTGACIHCLGNLGLLPTNVPYGELRKLCGRLLAALEGVVRIADRKTDVFDEAHAAIAAAKSNPLLVEKDE